MKYFAGGFAMAMMLVIVVLLIRRGTAEIRETVKESAKDAARAGVDRAVERAPEMAEKTAGRVLDVIFKPGQSRTPAGVVGEILDTTTHAAKTVDDFGQELLPIDDEQERELGREVHRIVLENQKRIDDPSTDAKIKQLAEPILAIRGRKGVNYTFTLLNDPTVNAYSHVGGYIYLHKGLLEVARSDIELQFVLGHEIGHVDLKHVLRGFTYSLPIGNWSHEVVAQLAQLAYCRIAVGYSQELEFEADEYGFRRLLKIGRTREEALSFPAHFARYAVEMGWDKGNRRPSSTPGAVLQEIQDHFRTHPPADQRLKRLEGLKV